MTFQPWEEHAFVVLAYKESPLMRCTEMSV